MPDAGTTDVPTMAEAAHAQIVTVLEQTGWRIRGPSGAGTRLGHKPTTLESHIKTPGLQRPH